MTGALSITGCRWRGLGPTPATGQRFRLAAAIFVAVDLASEQRAARGAERRAEQLGAVARDLVAGEAADGAADQQAGRAIVLLAAITTVAAAPDAGVRIDPLVARGLITAILLAIEIRAFVDLAIALCRDCVRQTGISRGGADDARGNEHTHQALGQNTHLFSFPGFDASFPPGTGRFEGKNEPGSSGVA